MNFLWINFDCCTLGNYLIASVVKVLVYGLIYIVPLVLITYSIIKFTKKKKEKKRTKKLIIGIVIALVSLAVGIGVDLILTDASETTTTKQSWTDCYNGICLTNK